MCDNSYLQLLECEASTSSCPAVVLDCGTLDDWAQFVNWAGCDTSGFGETVRSTARLAAGLLEVDFDAALPVFVEMPVGDYVVVLDRLQTFISTDSSCGGVLEGRAIEGDIWTYHPDDWKTQLSSWAS